MQSPKENAIDQRLQMRFGATVEADGRIHFGFWAPTQDHVSIRIEGREDTLPMTRENEGWFSLVTDKAQVGDRYTYVLADGRAVPDPASLFQPQDVYGPSEIIDPARFEWNDLSWKGRPWEECVIYELHIGSFTPEGTFLSAIEKLDHLATLGVTAIEIMPIADFPGSRNWGYDGVYLFAPDSAYGRPEDLRRLIAAAHERGLMVLLDVVYNHFGPEGNLIGGYAPRLFTDKHETPWGNAINYGDEDSVAVREFIISNACHWIKEFRFDGLRLDAVHAIIDESEKHILLELAERVRETAGDRHVHLILENDLNQAHLLERNEDGSPRWYNAQWNDDFHHCLHAAVTQESFGYYCAYNDFIPLTARALAEGFAYQGEVTPFTNLPRGEASAYLPPTAFVNFIQNHDQIGNRAFGERITDIAPVKGLRAITAIYLLSPQIPMLFMGEEWCAPQPFQYFCAFEGDLGEAIRKGRREEFAAFPAFSDPETRELIPDPTGEAAFRASKLDWRCPSDDLNQGWLKWYQAMLKVRREKIIPYLQGAPGGVAEYRVADDKCIEVTWILGDGKKLSVIANLQNRAARQTGSVTGEKIWMEGHCNDDGELAPWTVMWFLE